MAVRFPRDDDALAYVDDKLATMAGVGAIEFWPEPLGRFTCPRRGRVDGIRADYWIESTDGRWPLGRVAFEAKTHLHDEDDICGLKSAQVVDYAWSWWRRPDVNGAQYVERGGYDWLILFGHIPDRRLREFRRSSHMYALLREYRVLLARDVGPTIEVLGPDLEPMLLWGKLGFVSLLTDEKRRELAKVGIRYGYRDPAVELTPAFGEIEPSWRRGIPTSSPGGRSAPTLEERVRSAVEARNGR